MVCIPPARLHFPTTPIPKRKAMQTNGVSFRNIMVNKITSTPPGKTSGPVLMQYKLQAYKSSCISYLLPWYADYKRTLRQWETSHRTAKSFDLRLANPRCRALLPADSGCLLFSHIDHSIHDPSCSSLYCNTRKN